MAYRLTDERKELIFNGFSRSKPFDEFFEQLDASKEETEERKKTAEFLEDAFLIWFSLQVLRLSQGVRPSMWDLSQEIRNKLHDTLEGLDLPITSRLADHIESLSLDIAENTYNRVFGVLEPTDNDLWYVSNDRARFVAENEAQTIHEIMSYEMALALGKTKKVWKSELLPTTRAWHEEASGQVQAIEEPFIVNGELMLFPRDDSLGASAENIVNCVCHAEYR